MRINIRKQPLIKSAVYSLVLLASLLFSETFLPSLGISTGSPNLLCAAITLIALFEGVNYATFFGALFGVLQACMTSRGVLILPLFYFFLALICSYLFENFFVRNFFSWLIYTLCGLVLYEFIGLFSLVGNWNITAADALVYPVLPELAMSVVASLVLYPIFRTIAKRTTRKNEY